MHTTSCRAGVRAALFLAGALCALSACGSDGNDPPAGTDISVSFCSDDEPYWLAFQDGDGAWVHVEPTAGGTFEYTLTTGRGGVALVSELQNTVTAYFGTSEELNTINCTTGSKTVNGTVASLAEEESAGLYLGLSTALASSGTAVPFSLADVPDGPQPFVAVRASAGASVANSLILRRDVNAANNSTLPVVDFATGAVAPVVSSFALTGVGGGSVLFVSSEFYGYRATSAALLSFATAYAGDPATDRFAAFPLDQLADNEVQFLSSAVVDQQKFRFAGVYFRAPSNRTVTFGPDLNEPDVATNITLPYLRPQMFLTSQPGYGRWVSVYYSQATRAAYVSMTAGYAGGTPETWILNVPDLSAAEGWDNAWALVEGAALDWEVRASGGKDPSLNDALSDGDVSLQAARATFGIAPAIWTRNARGLATAHAGGSPYRGFARQAGKHQ